MEQRMDQAFRRRSGGERRSTSERRRGSNRLFVLRARHTAPMDRRRRHRRAEDGWSWVDALRRLVGTG
jgi:hypothetical protein